jgi:hypothetical protein
MPVDALVEIVPQGLALVDTIGGLLYAAGAPDGLGPDGLAAGGAAAAAAAAAASTSAATASAPGADEGTVGGANVGRNDATRPRLPSTIQARRDVQAAYDRTMMGRADRSLVDFAQALQKWAASVVGERPKGTAPSSSKA